MDEWRKAMLKHTEDELEKKVTADLARLREIINRKPVLPETMDIRIIGLINTPYGPRGRETGIMHLHYVTDSEVTVQPTTTIGEIKEFLLGNMATLEYNRIELEYWGVNLPDKVTLQQICNKWPFMKAKILHLHIFFRNATFQKLYKCFIGMGISQENAKNQTKTIMQHFKDNGIEIKMGLGEGKSKIQAQKILDTFQDQSISDDEKKEIIKTIAKFFRNRYVDINVFNTETQETKPSTNNIVDSFQKKYPNTGAGTSNEASANNNVNSFKIKYATPKMGKEDTNTSDHNNDHDTFLNKHKDSAKNKQNANDPDTKNVDTYQNKIVGTKVDMNKEKKTTKQTMGKINTSQDNGVDSGMSKEKTKKENKDTFHDDGDDASMKKKNNKKQAHDEGLTNEKSEKLVVNLKDSIEKVVDREKEITEKLNICRARHLELRKLFPPLPRTPDQE